MKNVLFILLFLPFIALGQVITADLLWRGNNSPTLNLPITDTTGKADFTHLILYWEISNVWLQSGFNMSQVNKPAVKCAVFNSEKEALTWLNTEPYTFLGNEKQSVRLRTEQIIGLYDLRTAKKIELAFKTEKKSKPKQVVIEAKEWVDEFYQKQ